MVTSRVHFVLFCCNTPHIEKIMGINITLSQILAANTRKPFLLYSFQTPYYPHIRQNCFYSAAAAVALTSVTKTVSRTNSGSRLKEKLIRNLRSQPWTAEEDAIIIEHGSGITAGTGEIKTWTELRWLYFKNRSLQSVRNRWQLKLNPCLIHGPLTTYEREMVYKGVQQCGLHWEMITKKFLPGRTPQMLRNWWYLTGDPNINHGQWSPSEDNILVKGVQDFGFGNWSRIQNELLPHRSRVQIMKRYTLTLIPGLQMGMFSPREQIILLRRYLLYGTKNWNKIAEGLPGRTGKQCAAAWLHVDPTLRRNFGEDMGWSEKELENFWTRVSFFGNRWVKIAKGLPGRSAIECSRWFYKYKNAIKETGEVLGDEERSLLERRKEAKLIGEAMIREIESGKNTNKRKRWSNEEDLILQEAINKQKQTKKSHFLDWAIIASQIPGRNVRSCIERWEYLCWENNKDARTRPWTVSEDEQLDALFKQHGDLWDIIADKMSNRTPRQCRYRWQKHLSPGRPWLNVEVRILQNAVKSSEFNWDLVASKLSGRSPDECRKRWETDFAFDNQDYQITPRRVWTKDEEKAFSEAIEISSVKNEVKNTTTIIWDNVAALVGTRTKDQCMAHFKYAVRKNGPILKWSWEEEMKLFEAVHKFRFEKDRWKKISDFVGGNKDAIRCQAKYYNLRKSWKSTSRKF